MPRELGFLLQETQNVRKDRGRGYFLCTGRKLSINGNACLRDIYTNDSCRNTGGADWFDRGNAFERACDQIVGLELNALPRAMPDPLPKVRKLLT